MISFTLLAAIAAFGDLRSHAKKVVFVHAGLHKTGTSYIQETLYTQRKSLLPQLLYDPFPWRAHHFLVGARNLDPTKKNSSLAKAARDAFFQRLGESETTTHLISSEAIGIASKAALSHLSVALKPYQVHAVLFYRNLLDYTISMYTQVARGREYHSSFPDFYMSKQFGNGDSFGTWVLSAINQIKNGLTSKLSIIDYEGARAVGDISDALLFVCGLGPHFLHKVAKLVPVPHRTSLTDEAARELLDVFQIYAALKRNCHLKWQFIDLHKTDLTKAMIFGQYLTNGSASAAKWLSCTPTAEMREQAHQFDSMMRNFYGEFFIAEFSNPEANHRAIQQSPAHVCGLNRDEVFKQLLDFWGLIFDQQLRHLPNWMHCGPASDPNANPVHE